MEMWRGSLPRACVRPHSISLALDGAASFAAVSSPGREDPWQGTVPAGSAARHRVASMAWGDWPAGWRCGLRSSSRPAAAARNLGFAPVLHGIAASRVRPDSRQRACRNTPVAHPALRPVNARDEKECIALTFGLTALQMKRTLALGNLVPLLRMAVSAVWKGRPGRRMGAGAGGRGIRAFARRGHRARRVKTGRGGGGA
ncbi:MAG TPA: hypothetical protein VMR39_01765 [Sphingobium sp.]|nr:hypothetical protein [Sphingobium sp.]